MAETDVIAAGFRQLPDQFINWRLIVVGGRETKQPYDPGTGKSINPHDPAFWKSHAGALSFDQRVGFVLTASDPYFFIDMDHCRRDNEWTAEAVRIFQMFKGAACEVSQSGSGIHVMGRCEQSLVTNLKNKWDGWLEFYSQKRFVAFGHGWTGNFDQDCTAQILQLVPKRDVAAECDPGTGFAGPDDDDELVRRMLASRGSIGAAFGSKATIQSLWAADAALLCQFFPSPSNDAYDRSAADAALMAHLAFWTGKSGSRMDRLFRRSGLMRSKYAERADYRNSTIRNAIAGCRAVYDRSAEFAPPVVNSILPGSLNEDVLAQRFSDKFANVLRYVAKWNTWMIWKGGKWQKEETIAAYDLVRSVCREAVSHIVGSQTQTNKLVSAATVSAVEKHAKADRRHAATSEQWDTDPWSLNTPAGVVDLRTGTIRPHNPDDHITKMTRVPMADRADCPKWIAFLNRTFTNDLEMISFVQRIAGYCLTGSTREHALFFGYGSGGNGKGVLLNTLNRMLNDYAAVAPIETFSASAHDRHPTDLAFLRGSRLVTAQETEEGRRWAESRIKSLTGGDPITARFMRGDFFTYQPNFKLFVAGNHKPGLRNVDNAMRRRFHLIPFTAEISADERDPNLEEKLESEWPAILRWAVEGCLSWQRIGLAAPSVVRDATNEYLTSEDCFGQWIEECCERDDQVWQSSSTLYQNFKFWAERSGEYVVAQKRFSQALIDRGFKKSDTRAGRGFIGLRLKTQTLPGMVLPFPMAVKS
ncbi:phage/plasmid primase, P4 family [Mesorhizobium marinum]|uniref:Phage/plasmid primase, P4 family n=1 Tax=Mesorhizobium marinum TaxID=3228790 RepID=A0ABV3QZC1_9HYPH